MKKIYLIIIFLFSLLSLGCTSKISNEADTLEVKTEIIVDQDSDSNNGIDNDGIIDSKSKSDISIKNDIIDNSKTELIDSKEDKIFYFDNVLSSFEYPGKKVNEINIEGFIKEENCIPFEGVFIDAPVSGKMHFDNSKEEPVIERIEFVVFEDDLSQDDCQAYLYNTYGALIAEGTENDTDGQIYWRRYFTGRKILKYSKKAKENFYTITVE